VRLFTRNGFDWIDRYPRISAAVAAPGAGIRDDRRGGGVVQ
jgi:hypothetical protein